MAQITDHATFYTPTQLSERISATPEGFLLCRDVVIARTGSQDYTPREVPIEDDGSGVIKVMRAEDEVFRDETMSSFGGKPVTIGHPPEFVTPRNYKQYAVGFTQNVRRGTDDQSDYLVADLLLADEQAISLVQGGLREVSCGYEADYTQDAPGQAHQSNILGNHVALVEKCRCGGACSIKDEESVMKETPWKRFLAAVGVKDSAELEEKFNKVEPVLDEPEEPAVVHDQAAESALMTKLEALEAKLEALEAKPIADEAPADPQETVDKAAQFADAKAILPQAEIVAPGIQVKDGDDAVSIKRRALSAALDGDRKEHVSAFLDGQSVEDLDEAQLNAAFSGSVQLIRHINNTDGVRNGISTSDFGKPVTIDAINKANADFWNNRSAH